jgi:hypothetical protein
MITINYVINFTMQSFLCNVKMMNTLNGPVDGPFSNRRLAMASGNAGGT